MLIQWAYQVPFDGSGLATAKHAKNQDFRNKGLPEWIDWQFYLINAKGEGDGELTAERFRQMTRNLLSDRFQLKVHTETEHIDVLASRRQGRSYRENRI